MPTLRLATVDDAALITTHRHAMYADNQFATEDRLTQLDTAFEPWLRAHIADGSYTGILLEDETTKEVLAGGGIFLQEFPPHWMDLEPRRAYLMNFYTAPEVRGQGHANLLLGACVEECRTRGIPVITLHATRFGKPIYEKFGFKESNEMMLRLDNI